MSIRDQEKYFLKLFTYSFKIVFVETESIVCYKIDGTENLKILKTHGIFSNSYSRVNLKVKKRDIKQIFYVNNCKFSYRSDVVRKLAIQNYHASLLFSLLGGFEINSLGDVLFEDELLLVAIEDVEPGLDAEVSKK